mmetsp:Transcript_13095/g.32681  ORF Transcript_13095/g.32681 Transcript_13095/m.32681 type:complete len:243 (+) Transcript_13095:358-1086(+)
MRRCVDGDGDAARDCRRGGSSALWRHATPNATKGSGASVDFNMARSLEWTESTMSGVLDVALGSADSRSATASRTCAGASSANPYESSCTLKSVPGVSQQPKRNCSASVLLDTDGSPNTSVAMLSASVPLCHRIGALTSGIVTGGNPHPSALVNSAHGTSCTASSSKIFRKSVDAQIVCPLASAKVNMAPGAGGGEGDTDTVTASPVDSRRTVFASGPRPPSIVMMPGMMLWTLNCREESSS